MVVCNEAGMSARGRLGYFFVEIFSGVEEFSRALRRRGFKVYSFDLLQGDAGDLTRQRVRQRLRRLLRSGMCLGLLAGVPCTSFSRARGGGPRAIRSAQHPMGLPHLLRRAEAFARERGRRPTKHELAVGAELRNGFKLVDGNLLLGVSVDIFKVCRQMRVPFLWENLLTSFQWVTGLAQQVAAWDGVVDVTVHYCGYGTCWKKPTTLR